MTKKEKKDVRLYNVIDKKILKMMSNQDHRPRKTLSFYNYFPIEPIEYLKEVREELYIRLSQLEVLGRIYLATEGINAQISVLEDRFSELKQLMTTYPFLKDISINEAVEENIQKFSFYKLIVRIRSRIVADGLSNNQIDPANFLKQSNRGKALTPEEFHQVLERKEGLVVDVRNHYESEVGHFKNAVRVDCDTFKQQLPMLLEELKGKEEKKLLLYCTGGIRCEKASAFLKQQGFNDVNHLRGGIVNYARYVRKQHLSSHFVGKNFVFDGRLGERITENIISHCHQCGKPCDDHTNCRNDACHLLFIQCSECHKKFDGCCSHACMEVVQLPIEEQRKLRRLHNPRNSKSSHAIYKSRIRPRLQSFEKTSEN